MRPKRLDIFILRSFLLLFAAAFFICLFVLLMNILWRWVEELVGKGFTLGVLAKFFYLSSVMLVPEALPLGVLMASLITFGNFGERFELLAMKTAGISLLRIMRPLIIFCCCLAGMSFYFQNVVGPKASAKFSALGYSIMHKNPELEIPEGVFYGLIPGYNMYAKHKNPETGVLSNVIIYNLSKGYENLTVIVSDSAMLETTADKQFLYMHLYNGEQFSQDNDVDSKGQPYRRESFREKHILVSFDSDFQEFGAGIMSSQVGSKNMSQIMHSIDSLSALQDSIGVGNLAEYRQAMSTYRLSAADSVKYSEMTSKVISADSVFAVASRATQVDVLSSMRSRIQGQQSELNIKGRSMFDQDKTIRKHWMQWMKKLSLSLSILIFFFIGAPLGAIIRKGGLGVPVIISVMTFILYYITQVSGEKMYREGEWSIVGCWLSTIVLAPLSVFLTAKANKDSTLFQMDVVTEFLRYWFGSRQKRNIVRKDVVIEDPDVNRCKGLLERIRANALSLNSSVLLNRRPDYTGLFFRGVDTSSLESMNGDLEELVTDLGNSRDRVVLDILNGFPIIQTYGVQSPFGKEWANRLVGIVFPIGLLFYLRAWLFSRKIKRQTAEVSSVAERLTEYSKNKQIKG
ncbi:MAG: LptF/LptG family permease [Bacteroidaceae bacterium]|nr:LptF/LptG family permease [Bacteroidaceae bacterium]